MIEGEKNTEMAHLLSLPASGGLQSHFDDRMSQTNAKSFRNSELTKLTSNWTLVSQSSESRSVILLNYFFYKVLYRI